ncbi:zinc-binding dehydrogenase [Corynebacterium phoceense]|uniref:zinc-binding dehydrogenase n=1 Tax=Corynebacterium phoceense TaxID=1686286 RepID=UPI00215C4B13|nr:zinc-binding dehydrogenase [Corynebacterium phoceense]
MHLPDELDFDIAAGLGCRFGTAYHAITVQGRVQPGETVAVIGCGVGLSCVMIARAAGARVVAVDRTQSALDAAEKLGATPLYSDETTVARIHELGGAHVSIDALGARITATMAIESLRPKGRHVQVGLLLGEDANPPLPYGRAIALELELLGSHGLATSEYAALLSDVASSRLDLAGTVGTRIGFDDLPAALPAMNEPSRTGSFGTTVAVL